MLAFVLVSLVQAAEVEFRWVGESIGFATVTGGYFALNSLQPRINNLVAKPQALDAVFHPQWHPEVSAFTDFMGHPLKLHGLNGPVITTVGIGIFAGITQNPQDGVAHSLIVSESIVVTALITEALKLSIARPRRLNTC